MSLLDPRTIIETVLPALAMPVILTTLEEPIQKILKLIRIPRS